MIQERLVVRGVLLDAESGGSKVGGDPPDIAAFDLALLPRLPPGVDREREQDAPDDDASLQEGAAPG